MLLVIDIGNTNIVFGIFDQKELFFDWRISTDKHKTSDEYGLVFQQIFTFAGIAPEEIKETIICSVVPNLMSTFVRACERYLKVHPFIVDTNMKMNIKNKYHNPKEVGADRLVNAVAAVEKYGGPIIIVDIGTAITFDYINRENEYLGGAIFPGIGISSEALFLKTAKLPKVELELPQSVIGTTTIDSIQSGLVYGYIGLIDQIIHRIMEEEQLKEDEVEIIGTGGYSLLIAKNSKYIGKVDKMITLDGLRLIYEMNKE
ncbi:MAG: type III pantothenate kinase [Tissierellia bacterium]|nr:type III pantothenate kinase [Tissierellia bacterium]